MFSILSVVSVVYNIHITLKLVIYLRYIGQQSIKRLVNSKSDIHRSHTEQLLYYGQQYTGGKNHSFQNLGHETLRGIQRTFVQGLEGILNCF